MFVEELYFDDVVVGADWVSSATRSKISKTDTGVNHTAGVNVTALGEVADANLDGLQPTEPIRIDDERPYAKQLAANCQVLGNSVCSRVVPGGRPESMTGGITPRCLECITGTILGKEARVGVGN